MSESFSGLTPVRFGARLRQLRKQAGMTQQAVSDYLQIHRTTYTKYETRCVTPDQEGLVRLAALFGVSVDYLLGRPTEEACYGAVADDEPVLRLTEQEQQLLLTFRRLGSDQRGEVLQQAMDYAVENKK